jgi:DNA repair protein RecN (Recombination protein N)
MLAELRVESLLLIERAELRLSPGLNVLTGETGAGKTVLAHALDLLLGARPRQGIVRPGASEAYVEGCFLVSSALAKRLSEGSAAEALAEAGADGRAPETDADEQESADGEDGQESEATGDGAVELVLGRRVLCDGRTRAYLNGRSVSVGDLRRIASGLIAFHGQHEHRRLVDHGEQLEILDGFCGDRQRLRRQACEAALAELRRERAELQRLQELRSARERELDLLQHELAEIEALRPQQGEHERLLVDRERLRQIDALRSAALLGAADLGGDEQEMPGAARLLAAASARIEALRGVDPTLDALGDRCEALSLEADDLAAELRRCGEGLEAQEGELQRLEERLADLERLMRKHGGDLDAVLAYAQRAGARREELLGAELAAGEAQQRASAAEQRLDEHVKALRQARRKAAPKLESAMRAQLAALAMAGARFEVRLTEREPTATGGDEVELMLAPNKGVAAAPLREIASGGELSRTMLALSVLREEGQGADRRSAAGGEGEARSAGAGEAAGRGGAETRRQATLVFDEVDSGIGGHTARAVGERLRDLASARQVLCITHLPQIASLAQRHFSIAKDSQGKSTSATVIALGEQEVVGELVRMLGANEDDAAATRHAEELLSAA